MVVEINRSRKRSLSTAERATFSTTIHLITFCLNVSKAPIVTEIVVSLARLATRPKTSTIVLTELVREEGTEEEDEEASSSFGGFLSWCLVRWSARGVEM